MDEHRDALMREAEEYARRAAVCESEGDTAGRGVYEARRALVEAQLGVTASKPVRAAHPTAETRPRRAREKR